MHTLYISAYMRIRVCIYAWPEGAWGRGGGGGGLAAII